MGCVTMAAQHRDAKVLLCPQKRRTKNDQPIEHTIVHELIHVVIEPLIVNCDYGEDGHVMEEQIVNGLTTAFTKKRNPSLTIGAE